MNLLANILLLFTTLFFISCGRNYDEELNNIPEYIKLTETLKAKKTFLDFPTMSMWRLLIDGNRQGDGPLVFDKEEPGYFAGLSRGFDFALQKDSEPLTVELLEEIRFKTTEQVSKTNDTSFSKEIGGNSVQFNLNLGSNASEQGLKDLKASLIGESFRRIDTDNDKTILVRDAIDRYKLYPYMKKIIDDYETSKKSTRDIIILSQSLDQLHPFNDGNVRTFVIILLQKELARNGLTPVILPNPNVFDAFSVSELEKIVADGQKSFQDYLK